MEDVNELFDELRGVTKWFTFGTYLRVPLNVLEEIESHNYDVPRSRIEMLNRWWTRTERASWQTVIQALEMADMLVLASKLKKYLLKQQGTGVTRILLAAIYNYYILALYSSQQLMTGPVSAVMMPLLQLFPVQLVFPHHNSPLLKIVSILINA